MDLTVVWALIIAFAIAAYVVMDGFDLGIGGAVQTGFRYALADFISFRDREACERVRGITRAEIASSTRSFWRAAGIRTAPTAWTLSAHATASITAPAPSTERCSTRRSSTAANRFSAPSR